MAKIKIQCVECGKELSYMDNHDLRAAHWTVLAWIVPTGEARAVCDECEYGKPKGKKKDV